MYLLGISALYHDSAVCLMKDGTVIFAASEERFTRKKHDNRFPVLAILRALEFEGITIQEIGLICFYEKPFQKFERIIDTYSEKSPLGFNSFKKAMKSWFSQKLWIQDIIKKELKYKGEIIFSGHHESHAAGAFFTSPFQTSTVITLDGVGERATASIGIGNKNKVELLQTQQFPHSLGLFYSAFTYYCGFKVNSGEYKLMGLAPYGNPIYADLMKEHFIKIKEDGSVRLNLEHFNFQVGLTMINSSFEKKMKRVRRKPETEFVEFYQDVAASAQLIVEESLMKTVAYAIKLTGVPQVCLSGGVALNCKANYKLLKLLNQKDIWIQPASGDSGGAIGAAFVGWYHHLKKERNTLSDTLDNQVYLGTLYRKESIKEIFCKEKIRFKELDQSKLIEEIAKQLQAKKIVALFQGRMEFGPRALGNRSILASPLFEDMKEYVNQKIKMREGFRPFAPIVKVDKMAEWFKMEAPSKYMLFTHQSEKKEIIPSCIHEDFSARVQTVDKSDNEVLYELLDEVERKSGVPILINTSFNVRGEPIVESPQDAISCFFNTGIDVLVIEGLLVKKEWNLTYKRDKTNSYELD